MWIVTPFMVRRGPARCSPALTGLGRLISERRSADPAGRPLLEALRLDQVADWVTANPVAAFNCPKWIV